MSEYFSIKKAWYYDTRSLAFLDGDRMLSYVRGSSYQSIMKLFKKEQKVLKEAQEVHIKSKSKQHFSRDSIQPGIFFSYYHNL